MAAAEEVCGRRGRRRAAAVSGLGSCIGVPAGTIDHPSISGSRAHRLWGLGREHQGVLGAPTANFEQLGSLAVLTVIEALRADC